jgi:hypothetical protein
MRKILPEKLCGLIVEEDENIPQGEVWFVSPWIDFESDPSKEYVVEWEKPRDGFRVSLREVMGKIINIGKPEK